VLRGDIRSRDLAVGVVRREGWFTIARASRMKDSCLAFSSSL
jgi:hypothetical protein